MKWDLGNLQCSQIKLTCLSDWINWRFFHPVLLCMIGIVMFRCFFCLFCFVFVFFLLNIFSFFTKQNSGHFLQCNQIKLIWLSDWIHWRLFHSSAWLILCCYFDIFFSTGKNIFKKQDSGHFLQRSQINLTYLSGWIHERFFYQVLYWMSGIVIVTARFVIKPSQKAFVSKNVAIIFLTLC